ncbi:hypothetical protein HED60_19255 [Planctomycetales bacterium ZRK34]|nr:hypothetical protein HED60_19255 [Planctomycetales bacterium ZRK34]
MRYIIAIVCPPLAILLVGRILAALINLVIVAAVLALAMMTGGPGIVAWLAPIAHAWSVIGDAKSDKKVRKMEQRIMKRQQAGR